MIKIENDIIEFDYKNVTNLMQQATMLIIGIVREAQKNLPEIPTDFIVQDLFKSLRFIALLEDGMSEDEAFKILNSPTDKQELILD